MISVARVNYQR